MLYMIGSDTHIDIIHVIYVYGYVYVYTYTYTYTVYYMHIV